MMVPTSLENLMRTIELLEEHEKCERVRKYEIWDLQESGMDIMDERKIDPITPSKDEYEILALISTRSDHLCKIERIHRLPSFITEYHGSRESLQ